MVETVGSLSVENEPYEMERLIGRKKLRRRSGRLGKRCVRVLLNKVTFRLVRNEYYKSPNGNGYLISGLRSSDHPEV